MDRYYYVVQIRSSVEPLYKFWTMGVRLITEWIILELFLKTIQSDGMVFVYEVILNYVI